MYLASVFIFVCFLSASQCYVKVVAVNASHLNIKEDFIEQQCPSHYLIEPHKSQRGFEKFEIGRTKSNRKCEKGGKCKNRREKPNSSRIQNEQPKPPGKARIRNAQTSQTSRKSSNFPEIRAPKPLRIKNDEPQTMQNDQTPQFSRAPKPLRIKQDEPQTMQNDQTPQFSRAPNDPSHQLERKDERTAIGSLTYVFDSTGSMWNDLQQVKNGSAKILETMLESSCNHPIYNFVLVPFRDPDVGPILVTQNHTVFQKKLQEIQIHGGGECLENTFEALYKAVNISEPGSYIYVFTDAQSHDYETYYNDVSTLIQRKQSQVNFVLTDTCPDYHVNHPEGQLVFDKIASLSSGVVYHLKKNDTNDSNEVLKFVRTLSPCSSKVNLIMVDNPNPSFRPENHAISVDQTLKAFTVSVAGSNPTVRVLSPSGEHSSDVNTLLDLNNIKIVSVKNPEPGQWTAQVTSNSQHSVRCTGISDTNIVYGFTTDPNVNIKNTYHRPLKGANNFIKVQTTNDEGSTEMTSVEITAINGTILLRVPLKYDSNNVYTGGPFLPIDEPWFIAIKGTKFDERNRPHPFRRISQAAITPQLSESPYIEMPQSQTAWVGTSTVLTCAVKSLVPFTVRWFQDGLPKTAAMYFQQSADVEYRIYNVSLSNAGIYTCNVENDAGRTSQTLGLQVKSYPPKVTVSPQQKTAIPGESVFLRCSVISLLPYNVTWYNVRTNCPLETDSKSPRFIMKGNNVRISPVLPSDEGSYLCIAGNSEGQSSDKVWLTVHKKPEVKVTPDTWDFKKYDDIVLSCFVLDGIPTPNLTWRKDGQILKKKNQESFAYNELDIHIISADSSDAGTYECQASNRVGRSSASAVLSYVEEPSVFLPEKDVLIQTGEDFSIVCQVGGVPTPEVTWLFANHTPIKTVHMGEKFQVRAFQELLIRYVDAKDDGVYICRARNKLGAAEAGVSLTVGSAPRIQPNMNVTEVNIGSNISLCCIASGYPEPDIHWTRLKQRGRLLNAVNNTLTVTDAKLEDGGMYLCHAENRFGSEQVMVEVKIVGLVIPLIKKDFPFTTKRVIAGENVTLSCQIVEGNPPPKIIWFKDGRLLSLLGGEKIVLENVNRQNVGTYECQATNVAGTDSSTFEVQLMESPTIKEPWTNYREVIEGSSVELPCQAQGDLTLTYSWSVNGKPVYDSSKWYVNHNGALVTNDVSKEDTNTYTCSVSNAVGSSTRSVQLKVLVPPFFKDNQPENIEVYAKRPVTISCSHYGVPTPEFRWYKDDLLLDNPLQYLTLGSNVNDAAVYGCYVKNKAGEINRKINVTILHAPTITEPWLNYREVVEGSSIEIPCYAQGDLSLTYSWSVNGQQIFDSARRYVQPNGVLVINNAVDDDTNIYTCTVSNPVGSSFKTVQLKVLVPPYFTDKQEEHLSVFVRQSMTISCAHSGIPIPEFNWYKNDLELLDRVSHYLTLGSTVNDSGIYSCYVKNKAGEINRKINVTILNSPTIKESWSNYREVIQGSSVELPCQALGDLKLTHSWDVEGRPIYDSSKWYVKPNGTLLINKVVEADTNTYTCTVANPGGSSSKAVQLKVLVPPFFKDNQQENVNIYFRHSVTISCSHSGVPIPEFRWFKNDLLLNNQSHYLTLGSNVNDTAVYSCYVKNKAGEANRKINVTVLQSPTIKEPWTNYREVIEGSSLELPCQAQGDLTLTYSWRVDGKPIHDSTKWSVGPEGTLVINKVIEDDTNTYTCTVSNPVGSSSKSVQLKVLVPPSFKDAQQGIVNVVIGHNVTISCAHSGVPTPELDWYKDDDLLDIESHYLTLGSNLDDTGIYKCFVENIAGEVIRKVNVTVLEPPSIYQDNQETIVLQGDSVSLLCNASGYPTPNINWHSNILTFAENPQIRFFDNELRIINATSNMSGDITCDAQNVLGVDHRTFKLEVIVPPKILDNGIPSKVTLKEGEDYSLPCLATGKPIPQISWKILSTQRTVQQGYHEADMIVLPDNTLVLTGVVTNSSDIYSCVATNEAGVDTKNFSITVEENEIIVANPEIKQINVMDSNNVTFTCDKPPSSWIKDNKTFEFERADESCCNFEDEQQKLTIHEASVRYTGLYQCLDQNGKVLTTFNLTILTYPLFDEEEVETDITATEGDAVVLKCAANGTPKPLVTWRKRNITEKLLVPVTRHTVPDILFDDEHLRYNLYFPSIRLHHAGTYQCTASNQLPTPEEEQPSLEREFKLHVLPLSGQ